MINVWQRLLLHIDVSAICCIEGSVCVFVFVCVRKQCVILRLAEAQELPSGSSHAASVCYVTLLFSHYLATSHVVLLLYVQRVRFVKDWIEGILCADGKMRKYASHCNRLQFIKVSAALSVYCSITTVSHPHSLTQAATFCCDTLTNSCKGF